MFVSPLGHISLSHLVGARVAHPRARLSARRAGDDGPVLDHAGGRPDPVRRRQDRPSGNAGWLRVPRHLGRAGPVRGRLDRQPLSAAAHGDDRTDSPDGGSFLDADHRSPSLYQTRIRLPDAIHTAGSTPPLVGYQVGAFAFVRAPQVRLFTSYLAATPDRQATQTYAMRANQVSLDDFALKPCYDGDPACQAPAGEEDVHVPSDKLPDDSLLAGWNLVKQLWTPRVSVTASSRDDCPGCDTIGG
jgi:hypothetical protein